MRSPKQPRNSVLTPLLFLTMLLIGGTLSAQSGFKLIAMEGGEKSFARVHIVQSGETLYGLAREYQINISEIKTWNGLSKDMIYPGQRLLIQNQPEVSTPVSVSRSEEQPKLEEVAYDGHLSDLFAASSGSGWHEVASSDTDWSPFPASTEMDPRSIAQTSRTISDPASALTRSDAASTTRRRYYEVKAGDDIYSIADAYKVRVDELRAWNALIDVLPGDVIVVGKQTLDPMPLTAPTRSENSPSSSQTIRGLAPATTRSAAPATRSMVSVQASDRPSWGQRMETGPYVPFEGEAVARERFYALHKNLPVGSSVMLAIPNNQGFIKVKIVGALPNSANANLALSIDCIRLLEGANAQQLATIYYNERP